MYYFSNIIQFVLRIYDKELEDNINGIKIGGKNYTNLQYADDAVFVSDQEAELQTIITSLCEICKEYGLEVNVKKTKTMVLNKSGKTQCTVTANGTKLEQVSQYKYLG